VKSKSWAKSSVTPVKASDCAFYRARSSVYVHGAELSSNASFTTVVLTFKQQYWIQYSNLFQNIISCQNQGILH